MALTTGITRKQYEQSATPPNQPRCFIRLPKVKEHAQLSTSEIYRRIAAGTFPAQIMLGPKSVVWIEAEVLAWCEERIAASRRPR